MESKDNLLGIVQTLWKWRKPVLIVTAAAAVGTAIITLLLPNYYKATTTFLAASPDLAKPELLFNTGGAYRNEYGNANDIDRLLTIAESSELVNFLVDSFSLYEHYRINKEKARAPYLVQEKFFKLYNIEKTKRDAIELSVEDRDRQLAAQIANAAREKIDEIAQHLIKESQRKAIETFRQEIETQQAHQRMLGDTLNALRRYFKLYNTVAQTEALTAQLSEAQAKLIRDRIRLDVLRKTPGAPRDSIIMLNALVQGAEVEVESLQQQVELLNQGIAPVNTLERQYFDGNQKLSRDLERLTIWERVYNSYVPAVLLIEAAEVPIIKSRPKRSVIVIAAGLIAFIFSTFAVLLFENYRVDWKAVFSAGQIDDAEALQPKTRKKKKKQTEKTD